MPAVDDFRFMVAYAWNHAPAVADTHTSSGAPPSRLEKRVEALQRVKLDGFQMVISELEVEQDYLRRA